MCIQTAEMQEFHSKFRSQTWAFSDFPMRDRACGCAIQAFSRGDGMRLKGIRKEMDPRNVPEGYGVLGGNASQ